MRALIIDDEQYVRLVLEHTLREEGCDVVVADGSVDDGPVRAGDRPQPVDDPPAQPAGGRRES